MSTLSIKVDQLTKNNNESRRYGLNDITSTTGFSNYFNSGKISTLSKENHNKQDSTTSTIQIMQLLQSLQSMTLSNLQQLQKKFSLSYNDIESKCGNMQLKFMGIWKQAQNLINTLTHEVESSQNKIRTMEDKLTRDRQLIQTNMHDFQQHVNDFINRSNNKFIESVEILHQQMANKTSLLQKKLNQFSFQQQLQKLQTSMQNIKKQLQTKMKKIDDKILQNLEQTQQQINQKFQSNTKKLTINLQTKFIQKIQQQTHNIKQKLTQLEYQFKQNLKNKTNFIQQNNQKHKKQILEANQNSQESYQPWSESLNSLQNYSKIKKQLPPPKNLLQPATKLMSNKFIPQNLQENHQSYSSRNRLQNRFGHAQKRQEQKKDEQQMGFVRGIAGLRNLKKKQEERKGSLSRDKNKFNNQPQDRQMRGMRNPLTRVGGLRPIQVTGSPSKMGKKPLPPLASQKTFARQPQRRLVNQYNMYQQQYSSPSQEQEGEQSYFLDQQGYLIDKQGNRLVNQNGEQIQLTYEDLQRLKQLNDEGY